MTDQRVTLTEAVDLLVAAGRSVNEAEVELLTRLGSGQLQAIAAETELDHYGSDYPICRQGILLRSDDWRDAQIDRALASAYYRYIDFELTENSFIYSSCFKASGVQLFRSQIDRYTQKADITKNKGGRPLAHDWARAGAAAAHYVIENDYPAAQAALVTHLLNWFESQGGKVPDRREVERFIAAMYDEQADRVGKT